MFESESSIWDLTLQNKLLRDRIREFESGEKYQRMREETRLARAGDSRTIRRLEKELERSRKETIHNRELWYGTCLDIEKECGKKLAAKDKELEAMQAQVAVAEDRYQKERAAHEETKKELADVRKQLEEEQEKNKALTARLGKNHRNSSKPSSTDPNHKTIHNSREKTGKSPGGQKGHLHHGRKRKEPTNIIEIPPLKEHLDETRYKATGDTIRKQVVGVRLVVDVTEYVTPEFRNVETGQRVHAPFPAGVKDDVNYDGTLKAMAYLLTNHLNASIDKARQFLKSVSHGAIDISNGFICNLSKQFSDLTQEERDEIFEELATAPTLHADFTFVRQNGKQAAVMITATKRRVLYQGRKTKGDEGVKGSPLEYYEGTTVTDHEASLIKHGTKHQECLSHVERYARGSAENEPEKKWAAQLVDWIKESVAYWNRVDRKEEVYDEGTADGHIKKLREILDHAREEYEQSPPTRYNKDGYNLFKRMDEDFEDYVLFLRDPSVPPTNNLSERHARQVKRKLHQVMSFRSMDGVEHFCNGLTIIETIRAKGGDLYDEVTRRFNQKFETQEI